MTGNSGGGNGSSQYRQQTCEVQPEVKNPQRSRQVSLGIAASTCARCHKLQCTQRRLREEQTLGQDMLEGSMSLTLPEEGQCAEIHGLFLFFWEWENSLFSGYAPDPVINQYFGSEPRGGPQYLSLGRRRPWPWRRGWGRSHHHYCY